MSNISIKVENLCKIYSLGEIGTGTISRDMERWFKTKVLKQDDPFLKIGETNDRASKGDSDIVYSLRDINFEIQQGDAVGIIGRNGAGKSTLLKILSRVTTPTKGKINIKGRVASLLEVGTGFHPELTGRENIYLNGAILGMRKREIDRKLDEIIDFSGVERYIDTPVKRYSSGMYVRLAFAVAAHLESEILIVDEVLAVGDAEFQKKCLGKMGEVSKGDGRTVLFVSHNISSIKVLCNSGVLLQSGKIIKHGRIDEVLNKYYISTKSELRSIKDIKFDGPLNNILEFILIHVNDKNPFHQIQQIVPSDDISIELTGYIYTTKSIRITIGVFLEENRVFTLFDSDNFDVLTGSFMSHYKIPSHFLRPGNYSVGIGGYTNHDEWIWNERVFEFEILGIFDSTLEKEGIGQINLKPCCVTGRMKI